MNNKAFIINSDKVDEFLKDTDEDDRSKSSDMAKKFMKHLDKIDQEHNVIPINEASKVMKPFDCDSKEQHNCDLCMYSKYGGYSRIGNANEYCLKYNQVLVKTEAITEPCEECKGKGYLEDN